MEINEHQHTNEGVVFTITVFDTECHTAVSGGSVTARPLNEPWMVRTAISGVCVAMCQKRQNTWPRLLLTTSRNSHTIGTSFDYLE